MTHHAEDYIDLARKSAMRQLATHEGETVDRRDMECYHFSRQGGNWVCLFTNWQYPDISITVQYDGLSTYTEIYQRVNRASEVDQEALFPTS